MWVTKLFTFLCEIRSALLNFIVNNKEDFHRNSSVHNTKNKRHSYRPNAIHSCFQKNAFVAGIRIFDSFTCRLRSNKKILSDTFLLIGRCTSDVQKDS